MPPRIETRVCLIRHELRDSFRVMEPTANEYAEIARRQGVVLLYLFGSRAKGGAASDSDWDFAALFEASPGTDLLPRAAAVEIDLLKHFEEPVEVTPLNEADPVLRFEVISTGQIVYARSERERVLFDAAVQREYQDSNERRRIYRDANRRYFMRSDP